MLLMYATIIIVTFMAFLMIFIEILIVFITLLISISMFVQCIDCGHGGCDI